MTVKIILWTRNKMRFKNLTYHQTLEKYLKFLKSQEIMSEPFRDKIGQFNNFFLPISEKINKFHIKIFC